MISNRTHLTWLRKLLEKKKEEDKMMEEIMNSVKEGKVKIAKMLKELMESFTSSFEHEKKKLERQYVSKMKY